MSLLERVVPGVLLRYLKRLRFPWLFGIMALILGVDLVIPDALPFVDEILLALASAILGSLRRKRSVESGGEPES